MKKYDIVYDFPIAEIERLSTSADADMFVGGLDAAREQSFVTLLEILRGYADEMKQSLIDKRHFSNWNKLKEGFVTFSNSFPSFPDFSARKCQLHILLAGSLAQMGSVLDEEEIDDSLFEIRGLTTPLSMCWYSWENSQFLGDSIALFSFLNFESLATRIVDVPLSPKLTFHFLATLRTVNDLSAGHNILVRKNMTPYSDSTVEAFARLHVLAKGQSIHTPVPYTPPPNFNNFDTIKPGNSYQQWEEVFHVLSEYNSRKEILLKYLTIYHVIENFMFKLPIVQLEKLRGNRMFTIRDFRQLYDRIADNELEALKNLFTTILYLPSGAPNHLAVNLVQRWAGLGITCGVQTLNSAIGLLVFKKRGKPLEFADMKNDDGLPLQFSRIVYSFRNATVHNKATEFHLTYATLDITLAKVIESFLLPSLEEICFTLVSDPLQPIWYTNKQLILCD